MNILDKYDTHFWVNKKIKKDIERFLKVMENYCASHGIDNDFNTFLNHGWNGICSNTYSFLFFIPKIYLVNSRSFYEYYSKLDKDFQDDLIEYDKIKTIQKELARNKKIHLYLKKIMTTDSIL